MLLFIVGGETKDSRVGDNNDNNYHDWKNRIKYLNGANELHLCNEKALLLLLSLAVTNVIFRAEFKKHYKNGVSRTISAKTCLLLYLSDVTICLLRL